MNSNKVSDSKKRFPDLEKMFLNSEVIEFPNYSRISKFQIATLQVKQGGDVVPHLQPTGVLIARDKIVENEP